MKRDLGEKRKEVQRELERLTVLERHPDPHNTATGVLLSDEIEELVRTNNFIVNFNKECLKAAGYELRVGDEWYVEGEFHKFGDGHSPNYIEIKPFQVAVLKTKEILCLPRFLIARWNIRVKHAYEGLLWVGAPQVDPGFKGYLFCPIYNLSGQNVIIKQDEPLALMDFVMTSKFKKNVSKEYEQKTPRFIIEEYVHGLESGLFSEVKGRLDEFERELRGNEKTIIGFASTVFGVLALVVTIIASLVITETRKISVDINYLSAAVIGISSFGAMVSLFGLYVRRAHLNFKSIANLRAYVRYKRVGYLSPWTIIPTSVVLSAMIVAGFLALASNRDYSVKMEVKALKLKAEENKRHLDELRSLLEERDEKKLRK